MTRLFPVLVIVLLAGCGERTADGTLVEDLSTSVSSESSSKTRSVFTFSDDTETIFKDEETGCQYIYYSAGITPRLNSNGRPMCSEEDPTEGEDE